MRHLVLNSNVRGMVTKFHMCLYMCSLLITRVYEKGEESVLLCIGVYYSKHLLKFTVVNLHSTAQRVQLSVHNSWLEHHYFSLVQPLEGWYWYCVTHLNTATVTVEDLWLVWPLYSSKGVCTPQYSLFALEFMPHYNNNIILWGELQSSPPCRNPA